MKSFKQIYDEEYAKHGFITYLELAELAAKEYATQAIEEQLKIAAEEARSMTFYNSNGSEEWEFEDVDKESILNCQRVQLT